MSMHLCGPELTTTLYKKRKQKVTRAQQEELERGWRDRNQRLKEMRLPKETFEQYLEWVYGRGKKAKGQTAPGKKITKAIPTMVTSKEDTDTAKAEYTYLDKTDQGKVGEIENKCDVPRHGNFWTTGACKTKPSPTYTGTKMIGIAVLHKSCLQPIFSQDEAIEVAHMRR